MSALLQINPAADTVLAAAVLKLRDQLELSQAELADIIGLHRTGITRLQKSNSLKADSKTGELALLLVRSYRALFALFGGNLESMRHFLRTPNHHTGGVPLEQMRGIQGLVTVVNYLDALRGRV